VFLWVPGVFWQSFDRLAGLCGSCFRFDGLMCFVDRFFLIVVWCLVSGGLDVWFGVGAGFWCWC